MPATNHDVATVFRHMADLLEIRGENVFRIRAYRAAAHTVDSLPESVAAMLARGDDLTELSGIGKDLAGKISEIVATGRLSALDRLARRVPGQVSEMLGLPGLGPKRVAALYEQLGIRTLSALEAACRDGRVSRLHGFGARTQQRVLDALRASGSMSRRTRIDVAEQVAEPLLAWMHGAAGVDECVVAGSFRRRCETVGDLDLLACADDGQEVVERLAAYDTVAEVLARGATRGSVVLRSGLQVDLRVVSRSSWGAALLYLTGSKAHNIALRTLAVESGLKLNEYGLFRGRHLLAGATEAEVYDWLGLSFIEPELRERRGEIEAASQGLLPKLVRREDLRGDLHVHSDASDGISTLEEIAEAAGDAGYEYVAITDHTESLRIAHGLTPRRLATQLARIDHLNEAGAGARLLKSAEVDILEDGRLDLPDSLLEELDLVVGAIHSGFGLSAQKQTARVLRAMDHPCFDILAHPTGRLIGERPPCAMDTGQVLRGALERGCFVEVNSQPERLDLGDAACRQAKEIGLKVSVSTDAHGCGDLDLVRYGVDQARRGWLEAGDVLNTRTWPQLKKLLRPRSRS